MRKELPIQLVNGTATVKEMTPWHLYLMLTQVIVLNGDSLRWSEIDPQQWDSFFISHGMIDIVGDASAEELNTIKAAFEAINAAFFGRYTKADQPENTELKKKRQSGPLLTAMLQGLESNCAQLVTFNHQQCWHYGWSFFLTTQALHQAKK